MFSRQNKENQIAEEDSKVPMSQDLSSVTNQDINSVPNTTDNNPEMEIETVKVVEKISTIISPYFIAIVGLYLYDRNFIIGFLLITIGIISLLKITLKDLDELVSKIKNFFSLQD